MATPVDNRRELGLVTAAYLRAAEAGRAFAPDGSPYTPAGLRRLRVALTLVETAPGPLDLAAVRGLDKGALEQLARDVVDNAGVRPSRVASVVEALRGLSVFAAGEVPARAALVRAPTYTMLALGAQVSVWMERIIVIAFVLTVIGLALELT